MNAISIIEFTELLLTKGYFYKDGHIYRENGKLASRMESNGYYTIRRFINGNNVTFMEHRVIWVMFNKTIDNSLVINHINYDRSDNRIENLELITQQENVNHSLARIQKGILKGCNSPKAILNEKEVHLIRHLRKTGWSQKNIKNLFNVKHENLISRVYTGARYGSVPQVSDIIAIYPLFVEKMMPQHNRESNDYMLECAMGMSGESNEILEHFKKYRWHGHELNVEELIDELGDVLFYVVAMMNALNLDASEIMLNNHNKLTKRYPDGFDANRSINREV